MKFVEVASVAEAVLAVKCGAECAVVVDILHDNPPGDWYVTVDVIAGPDAEAKIAAAGWQDAGPGWRKEGFAHFMAASDVTSSACRAPVIEEGCLVDDTRVIRRKDEETPDFRAQFASEVEDRKVQLRKQLTAL